MNKRRNRLLTAGGLVVMAIFLGTWLSAISTRLQAEDKQADAQERLPEQTSEAWVQLHSNDPLLGRNLDGLQTTLNQAGWTSAQSDLPNLVLMASWQSLQNGHLGRSCRFLYYEISDSQRRRFEELRRSRPSPTVAAALASWQEHRQDLSKPLGDLSDAILLTSWTRFLSEKAERDFLAKALAKLGARSVLADQASGIPREFLAAPDAAPVRFYQDSVAGLVIVIDSESEKELWRYPAGNLATNSLPPQHPRLVNHEGQWLVTLVQGSDIISFRAKTGEVAFRLRLHDRCLGLVPRGTQDFYVLQAGSWGPSKSRLIPATPSKWLEVALPGVNVKLTQLALASYLGEEPVPAIPHTESEKKALRAEIESLSTRLKRDSKQVFLLHRRALLFHVLGQKTERDEDLRTV
ncbi:MAG: hypothetical protein P1V97_35320, partial [Planctomycetota bacterium]|nr:hypothetical protein [Planctomycetota bacterium]